LTVAAQERQSAGRPVRSTVHLAADTQNDNNNKQTEKD
jgi:hypothetical protein